MKLDLKRTLLLVLVCAFAVTVVEGAAHAVEPIFRLRVNVDGLSDFMKERDPEKQVQVAMLRGLGISEIRIAVLPDEARIAVPVVGVAGDKATIRNLLTAENGPLAETLISKGDDKFQLLYGSDDETRHLDLTLTEHGQALVLSVPEVDAATRASAIARTALLENGRDRFIEFEFDVPEQLNLAGLQDVGKQYGVSKHPAAGMVTFMIAMSLRPVLEPVQHFDRVAGGIFVHPSGLNVVDMGLVFNEGDVAKTVHATLVGDQPPPRRFVKLIQLAHDDRVRGKATLDARTVTARYAWKATDDSTLAPLLQRALQAVTAEDMKPAPGPVASTYHKDRPLSLPIDSAAWEQQLTKAMAKSYAVIEHIGSFGDSGPEVQILVDPPLLDNIELLSGEVTSASLKSAAGDELKSGDNARVRWRGDGARLSIPVKEGTRSGDIARAQVRLNLTVPEKVDTCEFVAGEPRDTVKKAGNVAVVLDQLENDVAAIHTEEEVRLLLEAYDKDGNRLDENAGRWSSTSISRSFHGTIARLRAIVISGTKSIPIDLDLGFTDANVKRLDSKPIDPPFVRYNRSAFASYPAVAEGQLDELAVEHVKARGSETFLIALPRPPLSTGWEFHAFSQNKPAVHRGRPWSHDAGSSSKFLINNSAEADIRATFGNALVEIPIDGQVITIKKAADGESVAGTLTGGEEVRVVFDKNSVKLESADDAQVLSVMMLDAAGQPLLSSRRRGNAFPVGRTEFAWGLPASVTLEVCPRTVTRVIQFDMQIGDHDAAGYQQFKQSVNAQRDVVRTIQAVIKAQQKHHLRYGDNLASLHYLHDHEGKPLQAIAAEIAHADPDGADVFGYEHKPWNGYRFILARGETRNGEKVDDDRNEKPQEFAWDGGTIESRPPRFGMRTRIIAVPVDASAPTFVASYNNIYYKVGGNEVFHHMPQDMHQWPRFTLVDPPADE